MNLDTIKNIYIIGIEGAGTSALACILKAQGKNVIGSDEGDHFYYDVLKKAGIKVFHKFDEGNLKNTFDNKNQAGVNKAGLIKSNFAKATRDKFHDSGALSPAFNERIKKERRERPNLEERGQVSKAGPLERAKQVKGPAFSERVSKQNQHSTIDLIIYSTSIQPETNPELKYVMEATDQHFKIMSYPQALGTVFNQAKTGIAVCGTHGKTTTTAMLATAMKKVGVENLTALVGSKVLEWGGNTLIGCRDSVSAGLQRSSLCNDYFVIEADEYQNKLQYYNPKVVILTSADYDHPDFFKSEEEYKQVFKDFVARIPEDGFLVAYAGDQNVLEISKLAECEVIFYDELSAQVLISEEQICPNKDCHGKKNGCCSVPAKIELEQKVGLVGKHNLLNATAVLKVIQKLELDENIARQALQNFQGTARRFEIKGKYKGVLIIDDYAHHPVEVQATLQAAKEKYPDKNIKCIFHPHTFTRTEALLEEFSQSFTDADEIYLLDIFGSAREKQGGVSSDDLIEAIKKQNVDTKEGRGKRFGLEEERGTSDGKGRTSRSAEYDFKKCSDSGALSPASNKQGSERQENYKNSKIIKNLHTIPKATKYFRQNLQPNDILITMGAGDVYLVGEELIKKRK